MAVSQKTTRLSFSRGEKRWAGERADNFVNLAKRDMRLADVIALGLPEKVRWSFSKEVASSTHYFYQVLYKSAHVTMRFWAVADPRRNFDLHSHGFQIIRDHEVVYDFTA
jgi:hypothetical protein